MSAVDELARHPLLAGVPAPTVAALAAFSSRAAFAEGALVIREDDAASTLFLIASGDVALEVYSAGTGVVRLETLSAGDVLGLSWLFPGSSWHLDARAITAVDAWLVDGAALRARMEADHDLGYVLSMRLLTAAYDRLRRVRMQRLDVFGGKRA